MRIKISKHYISGWLAHPDVQVRVVTSTMVLSSSRKISYALLRDFLGSLLETPGKEQCGPREQ